MITTIKCPFCGGRYFLFGDKKEHAPDEPVTCPDCGTVAALSRLGRYEGLKAQKVFDREEQS